jgi:hypothetical protein
MVHHQGTLYTGLLSSLKTGSCVINMQRVIKSSVILLHKCHDLWRHHMENVLVQQTYFLSV